MNNVDLMRPVTITMPWLHFDEIVESLQLSGFQADAKRLIAALEAAPEVKAEPVAWLYRCAISGYKDWFVTQDKAEFEGKPVVVEALYLHPPASDVVERIRALQPATGTSLGYSCGFVSCLNRVLALIEEAK